jgi:hypothetical protein
MGVLSIPVANPTSGPTGTLSSNVIVETNAFYTNTLLASGGIYTSGAVALNGRRLIGSLWTTRAGASNSFIVQGSDDGVNWQTVPAAAWTTGTAYLAPNTTVAINTFYVFDVLLYNGLTRVQYTNGATAMVAGTDVFRLAGYLSPI